VENTTDIKQIQKYEYVATLLNIKTENNRF